MRCIICNKKSLNYPLCDCCKPKILNSEKCCRHCGIYTGGIIENCILCTGSDIDNFSLFSYLGIPKLILGLYKFHNYREFYLYYGELILSIIMEKYIGYTLVPIPPCRFKMRAKGWYQLDPITKYLSKNGVPVARLLSKKKVKSQKKLNRSDRLDNVNNTFYSKKEINLEKVLLFDDVYTTGSTINAAATIFKKKGISTIKSLTLCRD